VLLHLNFCASRAEFVAPAILPPVIWLRLCCPVGRRDSENAVGAVSDGERPRSGPTPTATAAPSCGIWGIYPFSSRFFSDLTHYVLSEYAFALVALSHYAADNSGHRMVTNLAVPILYPELRRKFGETVT
jgi:hypothetical protein